MKTIIYLTENRLEESIALKCREQLKKAAGNNPIISVSQKPIDLGKNICVGDIGRSWLNLYKQQLVGLKAATTKYIAIAEHDVLYTEEHFNFQPPRDDVFYYNHNCWFLQWGGNHPELNGMFSFWKNRNALSQLICDRELLIQSIEERLVLIDGGLKQMRKLGEPGCFPPEVVKAAMIATEEGNCAYLRPYLDKHLSTFKSDSFETVNPNLDIRWGGNFTGARRGKNRCYKLPYWGTFSDIIGER